MPWGRWLRSKTWFSCVAVRKTGLPCVFSMVSHPFWRKVSLFWSIIATKFIKLFSIMLIGKQSDSSAANFERKLTILL